MKEIYETNLARRIPSHTLGGLQRYIEHGVPTGGFLEAVLSNNLRGACERADDLNQHALFEIVSWLYNDAPSGCWGSPAKHEAWLKDTDGVRSKYAEYVARVQAAESAMEVE